VVDLAVLDLWLDLMILRVFSNLSDSVILCVRNYLYYSLSCAWERLEKGWWTECMKKDYVEACVLVQKTLSSLHLAY